MGRLVDESFVPSTQQPSVFILKIVGFQDHEFMIALQGLITPPQLVLVITQCPFSVPGKEMQWLLRPEK